MTFFLGHFAPRRLALAAAMLGLTACAADGGDSNDTGTDSASSVSATTTPTTAPTTDSADSSSSGSDTAPIDVDFVTDLQPIFGASCNTGCHEPGGIYAALDLTSSAAYNALTMNTPVYGSNAFVIPGDAEGSLLTQALRNTALTLRQMPLLLDDSVMPPVGVAGTPLPEADIVKFEAWIDAGANP